MKNLTRIALGAGLAVTFAAAPLGMADLYAGDMQVKVTGCVVKGDGDVDGFLLANDVEHTTTTTTRPTATGATVSSTTTSTFRPGSVLYWLDDDDHLLRPYLNQQVEIVGELEGDIDGGKIEVEREDGWVELEIDADGKKGTVRLRELPSAVGPATMATDKEIDVPYVVRKLDVKSARVIAANCV